MPWSAWTTDIFIYSYWYLHIGSGSIIFLFLNKVMVDFFKILNKMENKQIYRTLTDEKQTFQNKNKLFKILFWGIHLTTLKSG